LSELKGGFFLMKKPLKCVPSVYSNSETAIAAPPALERAISMNNQSADALIQDYLAALRILDLEGPSVLGSDATVACRRRILQRIAELDRHAKDPAPGQLPERP
jgi:hypothetical protein